MEKNKFLNIIEALSDVIEEKNKQIYVLEWQIKRLEAQIKDAEFEAKKEKAKSDGVLCKKEIEKN